MTSRTRRDEPPSDPIKDATIAALNRVLEPLIELMLDAGVTVHEFNKLVREQAVRVAMNRLVKEGTKESKSRAAIMTGLPRSEVARILRFFDSKLPAKSNQLPARRVLAAWHDNPRFSAANGEPAVLPIFGRNASFEQLVGRHGRGIPVRAMLDELTQMCAIDRLPDQRVKVRVRVPILTGLTPRSLAALGERSQDLLRTLAHNRRGTSPPLFEATAVSDFSDSNLISFVRREISAQGINFINGASSLLSRSEAKKDRKNPIGSLGRRVGVTVFYFEEDIQSDSKEAKSDGKRRRKNLRRHTEANTNPKAATR